MHTMLAIYKGVNVAYIERGEKNWNFRKQSDALKEKIMKAKMNPVMKNLPCPGSRLSLTKSKR